MKNKWILFFIIFHLMPVSLYAEKWTAGSYKKIIKKNTRGDGVYSHNDLVALILWKATPLTNEVTWAQALEYQRIYDVSDEEKEQLHQNLTEFKNGKLVFFVSFYAGSRRFDDLTHKKAAWDLRLQIDNQNYLPARIQKIDKHATPLDKLYYPYLTPWSQGYFVWFDVINPPKPWKLRIHGTQAKSELLWRR